MADESGAVRAVTCVLLLAVSAGCSPLSIRELLRSMKLLIPPENQIVKPWPTYFFGAMRLLAGADLAPAFASASFTCGKSG